MRIDIYHHYFDREHRELVRRFHDLARQADKAFRGDVSPAPPNQPKEQTVTGEDLLNQFGILKTAVSGALARGVATIDDLKAQVASGSPVTQDQLTQLSTSMQSLKDSADGFDITTPDAPAPIMPPAVPPSA